MTQTAPEDALMDIRDRAFKNGRNAGLDEAAAYAEMMAATDGMKPSVRIHLFKFAQLVRAIE